MHVKFMTGNRPEVVKNKAFSNLKTKASLTKIFKVDLKMTQLDLICPQGQKVTYRSAFISYNICKLYFKSI